MYYERELIEKMKVLKSTTLGCVRWHFSSDILLKLKASGWIVTTNEERERMITCMGLPITVHYDLVGYVDIE